MTRENPQKARIDSPPPGAAASISTLVRSSGSLAILVASILAGCGLALLVLARVFSLIPTDVQRLGIILSAFRSESPPPEIVVFGNSVLMSGIDARALSRNLPGNPVAWNCASTGQTLVEAFLLSQELPHSVQAAIYSIPIQPGQSEGGLHPQKYNTLFMSGFTPTARTKGTLALSHGHDVSELLNRSSLYQIFSSRWAIRQFIDTQTRVLLRPDLALEKSTRDLFHPQSYEKPIDPAIVSRFIQQGHLKYSENRPAIADGSVLLAKALAESNKQAGPKRRLLFLVPPIHPGIAEAFPSEIEVVVRNLKRQIDEIPNARFVDATRLLSSNFYIDDKHPTNQGASILTGLIAQEMSEF